MTADRLGFGAAGFTCTISFLGMMLSLRGSQPHPRLRKHVFGQRVQLIGEPRPVVAVRELHPEHQTELHR